MEIIESEQTVHKSENVRWTWDKMTWSRSRYSSEGKPWCSVSSHIPSTEMMMKLSTYCNRGHSSQLLYVHYK
jgi:hypothetical protein